eukprot:TRINITY_DN21243_c0_g1_i1.p1 TRINITY_DN21243_c0_g1~~TRINITY_DN21243_c0_g1_i1.p1  ORF type:complete len:436 (+),score=99.77 TRINITY_DN21243_c0_g1_i1:51-1310(+)
MRGPGSYTPGQRPPPPLPRPSVRFTDGPPPGSPTRPPSSPRKQPASYASSQGFAPPPSWVSGKSPGSYVGRRPDGFEYVVCHHESFKGFCGQCKPDGKNCVVLRDSDMVGCYHMQYRDICRRCSKIDGKKVRVQSKAGPWTRLACHHHSFSGHCGQCVPDGEHCVELTDDEYVGCHHNRFEDCCARCTHVDGEHVRVLSADAPSPTAAERRLVCHHHSFQEHCGHCEDDARHCVSLSTGQRVVCKHMNYRSCCDRCVVVDGDTAYIIHVSDPAPRMVCHHRSFQGFCGRCTDDGKYAVRLQPDQYVGCHHTDFQSCCRECTHIDGHNVAVMSKSAARDHSAGRSAHRHGSLSRSRMREDGSEPWPPPGHSYQVWTGEEWQARPPPPPRPEHAHTRRGRVVCVANLSDDPPPDDLTAAAV